MPALSTPSALAPKTLRARRRARQALLDRLGLAAAAPALILALAPLSALAVAALPISLACVAFGKVQSGKTSYALLGAKLALAPWLSWIVWSELRQSAHWRERERLAQAKRDHLGAPERALFEAIDTNDLEGVERALAQGADPDARDADGSTALILACAGGSRSQPCMKALLTSGADPALRDRHGIDALMITCHEESFGKAQLLLEHGARPQGEAPDGVFERYAAACGTPRWAAWTRERARASDAKARQSPAPEPSA